MAIVTEINVPFLEKGKMKTRKESGVVAWLMVGSTKYKFFLQRYGNDTMLVHWDSGWVLNRSLNGVRMCGFKSYDSMSMRDCAQLWLDDTVIKMGSGDKIRAKLDKAHKIN